MKTERKHWTTHVNLRWDSIDEWARISSLFFGISSSINIETVLDYWIYYVAFDMAWKKGETWKITKIGHIWYKSQHGNFNSE